MFKKDVYETYKEDIVNIKHLEGDLYEGYIMNNGKEVPYVVVSQRTGYYHGTGETDIDKVESRVKLYEGAYFDSRLYGENSLKSYYEVTISNVTNT